MALIKCKECGKEMSDEALVCPNCGIKSPKKSQVKETIVGLLFFAGVAAWFFSGPQTPTSTTAAAPDAPATETTKDSPRIVVQVGAAELYKAYESNEVAADEKIKGRIVEISGRVQAIDKDFMENIVINLATPNQFNPARLTMVDSEKALAINLKKGEKAVIRCEKMSRLMGSPSGSDCIFYPPPTTK